MAVRVVRAVNPAMTESAKNAAVARGAMTRTVIFAAKAVMMNPAVFASSV
jgi:hypothetical protein